jgi:hypothetical protein
MVEFALVVVLLMLLVFGIIEFSLAWNTKSQAQGAVRAGGRIASAMSRSDNLTTNAAEAVGSALKSVPEDEPKYVTIYRVAAGSSSGAPPGACGANCAKYAWDPVAQQFDTTTRVGGSGWPASQQLNNCAGSSTAPNQFDQVGVHVELEHPWSVIQSFVPGMADTVTLDPYSVFKLEPSPSTACSA